MSSSASLSGAVTCAEWLASNFSIHCTSSGEVSSGIGAAHPGLMKAHHELDAVDAAYGRKDFKTEAKRVAFSVER